MSARRRRHLAEALATLSATARLLVEAERAWNDLLPGMRAQRTDGTGSASSVLDDEDVPMPPVSDPTGEAVLAYLLSQAGRDEQHLDRLLGRIARNAEAVERIVHTWAVEMPANAVELAELERQAEPGCEIVARIKRENGPAHWEPEHVVSDVGGILPRPYRLGQWAYRFIKKAHRVPTDAETRQHLAGRRVMVQA